jgi:hypothetical protein
MQVDFGVTYKNRFDKSLGVGMDKGLTRHLKLHRTFGEMYGEDLCSKLNDRTRTTFISLMGICDTKLMQTLFTQLSKDMPLRLGQLIINHIL